MKIIFSILILFLFAILQITLAPHLSISGISPDFIFILIVFFSILKVSREAMILAFFGGLFLDLFSLHPLGINVLSFILIAGLFNFTSQNILKKYNLATFLLFGFIGTIVYEILVASIIKLADFFYLFDRVLEFQYNFIYFILPEAIYNTILVSSVFLFFRYLREKAARSTIDNY